MNKQKVDAHVCSKCAHVCMNMTASIRQLTIGCEMKIKWTMGERRERSEPQGKALATLSGKQSYRGKGDEGRWRKEKSEDVSQRKLTWSFFSFSAWHWGIYYEFQNKSGNQYTKLKLCHSFIPEFWKDCQQCRPWHPLKGSTMIHRPFRLTQGKDIQWTESVATGNLASNM